MSLFGGLKRILGREEHTEAFIETRLDRFRPAGPPPPPPPVTTAGADPLGSGLPPLAPPPPPANPITPQAPVIAPVAQPTPPVSQPTLRPKARPSGAAVRLLLDDGSTSELDDPELSTRAEYLVRNLLTPKPPAPKS